MIKCNDLLKEMMKLPNAVWFLEPVDVVKYNLPDYHQVITHPMDFGTIRNKIESGTITTVDEFAELMRLVFRNAITYNQLKEHPVHIAAKELSQRFENRYRTLVTQYQNSKATFFDPGTVSVGTTKPTTSKKSMTGKLAGRASTGGIPLQRSSSVGPAAYLPPVMDDTSHHLLEMQRKMLEMQTEIMRLKSEVMKKEVDETLVERRDPLRTP